MKNTMRRETHRKLCYKTQQQFTMTSTDPPTLRKNTQSSTETINSLVTKHRASESLNWDQVFLPTIDSSESLCLRVRYILSRLNTEKGLPVCLKREVTKTCSQILKAGHDKMLTPRRAQQLIEDLAAITYGYENLILSSSTLCQIRTLDLELHDRLNSNSYRRSGR